ncbi:MAG TPA: hypothetical protein VMY06_03730 [Sedimentisphaerales bacterium]|nr:hypothetical protein [Sedimentisphaerales bacterium]
MTKHRTLKLIHLASTAWFILCIGYILVFTLRQVGVRWWVIFSLSGHSTLLVLLLVSLYPFAIFRGVGRSQKIEAEHPLTSTNYYMVFYAATPFLGGLAGWVGMIGVSAIKQVLLGIALGTLVATFLSWVIVDPVVGLLEMLLPPSSRKHRAERLVQAKAEREKRQKDSECLLADVLAKEDSDRHGWQEVLKPHAEKLAELLTTNRTDFKQAEREAADIGVKAWQIGGLGCMRQLRDMAIDLYKKKHQDSMTIDYISTWWDGIGSWRSPSLQEMINL